jgi:hypothetical protein
MAMPVSRITTVMSKSDRADPGLLWAGAYPLRLQGKEGAAKGFICNRVDQGSC